MSRAAHITEVYHSHIVADFSKVAWLKSLGGDHQSVVHVLLKWRIHFWERCIYRRGSAGLYELIPVCLAPYSHSFKIGRSLDFFINSQNIVGSASGICMSEYLHIFELVSYIRKFLQELIWQRSLLIYRYTCRQELPVLCNHESVWSIAVYVCDISYSRHQLLILSIGVYQSIIIIESELQPAVRSFCDCVSPLSPVFRHKITFRRLQAYFQIINLIFSACSASAGCHRKNHHERQQYC